MEDILRERGVEFDVIRYIDKPLDRATLERIVDAVPDPPATLVRKDKNFQSLGLNADDYVERDAVVDLLVEHGELMERPVIFRGERAVIGRPSEKVLDLLD